MPVSLHSSRIFSALYSDEEIAGNLDDAADIAAMIAFERALARVQGRLAIIPEQAALEIDTGLKDLRVPPDALSKGTLSAGVPVPALVTVLRDRVGGEAATWIHWGATSQDVMDTAMILQVKACLATFETRLGSLIGTLQEQSNRHARQLMAGRTRSQISTPITLGYRIAQWAHPLIDAEAALPALKKSVLKVQFGGASGVNSAIAPDGSAVSKALAQDLGLYDSPSWHVNRTPLLVLAAWLQQITSALAKIAGDLILLGRSEIGEVASGTGGGSSTMPQKSNPVQAEAIVMLNRVAGAAQAGLAAAASPAEERDGATWPLEWMFLPQMLLSTGAALRHAQQLGESLTANPGRLGATLAANPEIMAEAASFLLAKRNVPRAEAKEMVAKAAASAEPFALALAKICPVEIDWETVLDPASAIAPSEEMSRRIFARRRRGD